MTSPTGAAESRAAEPGAAEPPAAEPAAAEPSPADPRKARFAIILLLLRGTAGLVLGLAVLAAGQEPSLLSTIFAAYWLLASLVTIRWALSVAPRRGRAIGLVVGAIGVLAALALLLRSEIGSVLGADQLMALLGTIMILTGLFRILGQFRDEARANRRVPLGILEIAVGIALILSENEPGPLLALFAGIWAILGGAFALLDARRLRAAMTAARPGNQRPEVAPPA